MPEVADFSKLKLMQSIDSIIEDVDFANLVKLINRLLKLLILMQK